MNTPMESYRSIESLSILLVFSIRRLMEPKFQILNNVKSGELCGLPDFIF